MSQLQLHSLQAPQHQGQPSCKQVIDNERPNRSILTEQANKTAVAYRLAAPHGPLVHALDVQQGGQVRLAHALLQGPVLLGSIR